MADLPILQEEGERMEDSIKQEGCHLSVRLQGLMYHYVAVPVVKARWAIVGKLRDTCFYVILGPQKHLIRVFQTG